MADKEESETQAKLNEEGRLVVTLTRAIFAEDMDEVHRIIGRHMDKRRLQVSRGVMDEYDVGRRINDD